MVNKLKLNPGHTVPTIVDGDLSLSESRAIMQYLCNRYAPESQLYPNQPKARASVDRWLNIDLSFFLANRDALVVFVFVLNIIIKLNFNCPDYEIGKGNWTNTRGYR